MLKKRKIANNIQAKSSHGEFDASLTHVRDMEDNGFSINVSFDGKSIILVFDEYLHVAVKKAAAEIRGYLAASQTLKTQAEKVLRSYEDFFKVRRKVITEYADLNLKVVIDSGYVSEAIADSSAYFSDFADFEENLANIQRDVLSWV